MNLAIGRKKIAKAAIAMTIAAPGHDSKIAATISIKLSFAERFSSALLEGRRSEN